MGLDKHPRPNQDTERRPVEGHPPEGKVGREPRGIQHELTEGQDASARNTPPAGKWNDVARNENENDNSLGNFNDNDFSNFNAP